MLQAPALIRVEGKHAALDMVAGIFKSIQPLRYRARNIFVDGHTSLIEFVRKADRKTLTGVDVIEWQDGKMLEMRAYLDV